MQRTYQGKGDQPFFSGKVLGTTTTLHFPNRSTWREAEEGRGVINWGPGQLVETRCISYLSYSFEQSWFGPCRGICLQSAARTISWRFGRNVLPVEANGGAQPRTRAVACVAVEMPGRTDRTSPTKQHCHCMSRGSAIVCYSKFLLIEAETNASFHYLCWTLLDMALLSTERCAPSKCGLTGKVRLPIMSVSVCFGLFITDLCCSFMMDGFPFLRTLMNLAPVPAGTSIVLSLDLACAFFLIEADSQSIVATMGLILMTILRNTERIRKVPQRKQISHPCLLRHRCGALIIVSKRFCTACARPLLS